LLLFSFIVLWLIFLKIISILLGLIVDHAPWFQEVLSIDGMWERRLTRLLKSPIHDDMFLR
jgi:hypothetical protein